MNNGGGAAICVVLTSVGSIAVSLFTPRRPNQPFDRRSQFERIVRCLRVYALDRQASGLEHRVFELVTPLLLRRDM